MNDGLGASGLRRKRPREGVEQQAAAAPGIQDTYARSWPDAGCTGRKRAQLAGRKTVEYDAKGDYQGC